MKLYKKYDRIPLLQIVEDADAIYTTVEEAVTAATTKAVKKYNLSQLGKLLATAAQWTPDPQISLDLTYDFTSDDIEYFRSKMKRQVDGITLSSMLNTIVCSVGNKVGNIIWRGYLTVEDILRLYIYKKSDTSCNEIKSKFKYANEYKPINDTFVSIQGNTVKTGRSTSRN